MTQHPLANFDPEAWRQDAIARAEAGKYLLTPLEFCGAQEVGFGPTDRAKWESEQLRGVREGRGAPLTPAEWQAKRRPETAADARRFDWAEVARAREFQAAQRSKAAQKAQRSGRA